MPELPEQRVLADISVDSATGLRVTLTHPNGISLTLTAPVPDPPTILEAGHLLTDMLYPAVLAALQRTARTPHDLIGLLLLQQVYQAQPDSYRMDQMVLTNDLNDPEALRRLADGSIG